MFNSFCKDCRVFIKIFSIALLIIGTFLGFAIFGNVFQIEETLFYYESDQTITQVHFSVLNAWLGALVGFSTICILELMTIPALMTLLSNESRLENLQGQSNMIDFFVKVYRVFTKIYSIVLLAIGTITGALVFPVLCWWEGYNAGYILFGACVGFSAFFTLELIIVFLVHLSNRSQPDKLQEQSNMTSLRNSVLEQTDKSTN